MIHSPSYPRTRNLRQQPSDVNCMPMPERSPRPLALEDNMACLAAPWDPTTNIVEVFTRGAICRQFAEQGDEPIPDTKYLHILLQVFTNSGVFGHDIEDWEAKPRADKTIANMKTHFMEANKRRRKKDLSLKQTLSANAAGVAPTVIVIARLLR
jgi:hypothetical protein